ncbi:chemotaxis protein [Roseibium polysiphoniae]|uniref:Chemotaxis protein n=1 Tax=Roseibium polysiphoniae TaxID=2571221 RepID=A0A944GSG5_9HYPH|nr:chemotaxis protein [Roseibium polysiphoniae]MBS8260798.1 chemotaxis protein [Roseibium polysiphoniae]
MHSSQCHALSFAIVLAVLLALLFPAMGHASEPMPKQPYEMVRTLQSLQAKVAEGNSHALKTQRALLLEMDEYFQGLPAETWQEPRNARAAIVHVLSGGHPKIVYRLRAFDPQPAVDAALMEGALAYVEGREGDVVAHLGDIDPMDLPSALGGHVALIKAAVLVKEQPAEAMELLSVARLLMPGTLIEEAALRREVFVAGKLGDIERFQSLSLRYLRRFRGSIYAGDFQRRFSLALDSLGFGESEGKFSLLESLLAEFDEDTRRTLYLRLARTAVLSGQRDIVEKATDRAMSLAMSGSHEEALFKLYRAGALVELEDIKQTRNLLWSIDENDLSREEKDLMAAVYRVLNSVRSWPAPPEGTIGEFSVYEKMAPPSDERWVLPVMSRADDLISSTDELLAKIGS